MEDIDNFAKKNGATLSQKELELIYKYVKNDWKTIIFGNSDKIFSDLKVNLTPKNYEIALSLFNLYKQKFQNFL